jgi:hypothetical protein
LRPNAPTAFLWGINGAMSVCASVLAVVIALSWGISSAFWVGCVCYAVGLAALAYAARALDCEGGGAPLCDASAGRSERRRGSPVWELCRRCAGGPELLPGRRR